MSKILLFLTILTTCVAASAFAFDLLYQDEQGGYHYRCEASSAEITIVINRDSLRINGGPRSGIYKIPKQVFGSRYPKDLRTVRKALKHTLANYGAAYACLEKRPR